MTKNWSEKQKILVVLGINPDDAYDRHTWLNISGLNIDVTAKQFDSKLPAILISTNGCSGWHKKYDIDSETVFNSDFYLNYKETGRKKLLDDYYYLEKCALKKLSKSL